MKTLDIVITIAGAVICSGAAYLVVFCLLWAGAHFVPKNSISFHARVGNGNL